MFHRSTFRARRKSSTRPDRDLGFSVEHLEPRRLLAGQVQGVVQGNTLRLTGDEFDNHLVVTQLQDRWQVASGGDATGVQITGDLAAVRQIEWRSGSGQDRLKLEGAVLPQSLVAWGEGGQRIEIRDAEVGGRLVVGTGSGPLELRVSGSHLESGARLNATQGSVDLFFLDGSRVKGPLTVQHTMVGAGGVPPSHQLQISDSQLEGSLRWSSRGGDVTLRVQGQSQIAGSIVSRVDRGNDALELSDQSVIEGNLIRNTPGGAQQTILRHDAVVVGAIRARAATGWQEPQLWDHAVVGRPRGVDYSLSRNVTYAQRDNERLMADVYLPRTAGFHPAILMIHGGYWSTGSKAALTSQARAFAAQGFVVVNINYRLAPADPFPAQIHDVKSAVIWMRQNADQYQIDVERIGTYGYSAGGHLALLLATTDAASGLDGPDGGTGVSTRVQAVVAGGPAVDFRDLPRYSPQLSFFLGGTRDEIPAAYAAASPAHWLTPDDPPTMIFMGQYDFLVSRSKVDRFLEQLDQQGVTRRFHEVAGTGHLGAARDHRALVESIRFLKQQLI